MDKQLVDITINPDYKNFLNPLSDDEYHLLESSIMVYGCRNPIVTWNNTIVDGHHRYDICKKHKIPYAIEAISFESDLEAMEWMDLEQRARRNESNFARAERALRLKGFYSELAQENKIEAGKIYGIGQEVCLNSDKPIKSLDTKKELAKKANVGHDTINKVERINKALESKPNQEIKDQLRSGDISINQAFEQVVKNKVPVNIYTGNNEWYTPKQYIDSVRKVMDVIDLDPASNVIANQIIKAKKFYTIEDSGLNHQWQGNLFLNPPYSAKEIKLFIDKLSTDFDDIHTAIVLTNNSTDTSWWHDLAALSNCICFTRGRISFYNDKVYSSPTNGQTFFYIGCDVSLFEIEFDQYGLVIAC